MSDELTIIHTKLDTVASDVLVIKTKLNLTFSFILPMIIGVISLVTGIILGHMGA